MLPVPAPLYAPFPLHLSPPSALVTWFRVNVARPDGPAGGGGDWGLVCGGGVVCVVRGWANCAFFVALVRGWVSIHAVQVSLLETRPTILMLSQRASHCRGRFELMSRNASHTYVYCKLVACVLCNISCGYVGDAAVYLFLMTYSVCSHVVDAAGSTGTFLSLCLGCRVLFCNVHVFYWSSTSRSMS